MLLIFYIFVLPGIITDDNAYNYTLSQCGISLGDNYSLTWQVIGKRVHFELILSSIPKDEDFWIGIGFSKIQINSPVNESEVLAILKLQDVISLENFSIKFYMRPVLMNETFVEPVFDALICDLSALCMPYSINNSSNELHPRDRRQTFTNNNIQTNRTNNLEIPKLYNPVINPSSPNYTAVLRQNQEALSKYEDSSCTLPDPYWCKSYVKQYVSWQQTYNNLSIVRICEPLKTSVANADNRCCQAVRSIGC
ncbi:hypothetical protein X798_00595 [Onchocerca flexuosa]|uniref:DOMON domain-containing protein n=1 Tax=Onchocerca flexuosa TaxID=387005 RepID=A0A238C4J6_9BILA|nr:hypothetical protein X798_00595 [Onchocerca flexuosa]